MLEDTCIHHKHFYFKNLFKLKASKLKLAAMAGREDTVEQDVEEEYANIKGNCIRWNQSR